ncbi:MAG: bifunctional metallophosphatase/5'-nucleotidase [Bacteroidales bacterium]|nr:bifunctional metallophosphatase/5'-nucleotidase [Bacteroidales bacterium]
MKTKQLFQTLIIVLFFAQSTFAQKLVILHTNDMHSKLTGFGPELAYTPMSVNDDDTRGGFARLASLFNQEKQKYPNATLIVDAGDFLMGTIFHADEQNEGFQLRLMKKMGYDFVTLGNHEFDFSPAALAKIINSSRDKGEIPQIVASNLTFSSESSADDGLEKLFNEKAIVKYSIIEKNGLKIGIIGIVGKDADEVAPNAKPVRFDNQIKTVKKLADELKNKQNVDLLICLSHSGFYPDNKGGYEGEDLKLAAKVKNLDVIISGHTHVKTEKAIRVNNTIIVQTGAYVRNMGRLELDIENKKIKSFDFHLIPVDDKISGNNEINDLINDYKKIVSDKYFKPLGLTYEKPVAETDFTVKRNSLKDKSVGTMGQFVADAIKYYVDKHSENVDLAIVASGTIREEILPGQITAPDIFRISPLGSGKDDVPGYALSKIYISGKEVKKLMEVIVMAQHPGDDSYINFSGMSIDADKDKMMLHKVQKVYFKGKELDISKDNKKLYSIAASSYLLQFIGRIKKISHGLIKIVPKDKNGNPITDMSKQIIDFDTQKKGIQEGKTWIALIEYIESFKDTNGNGLPEIPEKYKK